MSKTKEAIRPVRVTAIGDGKLQACSFTSPEDFKVRAGVCIPPKDTVPVIFIPGIMGSNLRTVPSKDKSATAESKSSPVWAPPNGKTQGASEAGKRTFQSPESRQLALHPATSEVSDSGQISLPEDFWMLDAALAKERGWGTVHWESYGEILCYLEEHMNMPFFWYKSVPGVTTYWDIAMNPSKRALGFDADNMLQAWNPKNPFASLTKDEHKKLARYNFPVYACGYNWLQSNGESAKKIAERMKAIQTALEQTKYFIVKGFILVTHSMGGLVARRLVQLPQIKDQILGVVHGVQPVHGAAAVYRRFRAGTEGGKWNDIPSNAAAAILGWDAKDTTPVLAQSPGPLELLPNKLYNQGRPWLFLNATTSTGNVEVQLPQKGDPYAEIYLQREVWYKMVDESILDPAEMYKKKVGGAWKNFRESLDVAKDFHKEITASKKEFHPCTYAYFGDDVNQQSFSTIRWNSDKVTAPVTKEQIKTMQFASSDHHGKVLAWMGAHDPKAKPNADRTSPLVAAISPLGYVMAESKRLNENAGTIAFMISDKNSAGDGTVPTCSGEAVEGYGLKQTFRMRGFNHQMSYQNPNTRVATLYSIAKIVSEKLA